MVLEVFSNLEIKVKKSVDYIKLLKTKINNLKLKNKHLKEELKKICAIKEKIENKNIVIQESKIQWINILKLLLKKMNV